jgi:hypothetical protein
MKRYKFAPSIEALHRYRSVTMIIGLVCGGSSARQDF